MDKQDLYNVFTEIKPKGVSITINELDSDVVVLLTKGALTFEIYFESFPDMCAVQWGFNDGYDIYDIEVPLYNIHDTAEEHVTELFQEAIEVLNERVAKEKEFMKYLNPIKKLIESDVDWHIVNHLYNRIIK